MRDTRRKPLSPGPLGDAAGAFYHWWNEFPRIPGRDRLKKKLLAVPYHKTRLKIRAGSWAYQRLLRQSFSDAGSPPDRFGCVSVLPVLAQQSPYRHQHREDETLYHRRDLRHVELALVPPCQERGLKQVRPAPPALPLRFEDRREKVFYVVGRLDVACAPEVLSPSVPELVRLARLEDDRFAGPGKPRRLFGSLVAESALLDREGLLLVVMEVHRGSAARLDEVLGLKAIAGMVLDPPNEGESLPGPVLDGVWVSVSAHAPSVRGSDGPKRDPSTLEDLLAAIW